MRRQTFYSILITLTILSLFFSVFFLIEITDTANGSAVLSTKNQRQEVIALASGNLVLNKTNGDSVNKGEVIGIISSEISIIDISEIDSLFKVIETNIENDTFVKVNLQKTKLDLFESVFTNFMQYEDLLSNYYQSYATATDIENNKNEIKRLEKKLKIYIDRNWLLFQEIKEYKAFFDKTENIKSQQILSELEYLKLKKELDNLYKEKNKNKISINEIQNSINLKKDQINSFKTNDLDRHNDIKTKYKTNFLNLKNSFTKWKTQHLISSKIDGNLFLFQNWKKLDFIKLGEKILNVYPISKEIITAGTIDIKYLPKLKKGQEVLLRLQGYSYLEFGKVRGKLLDFSTLNSNRINQEGRLSNVISFRVKIETPIRTTTGKEMPYFPENPVSVEIILEKEKYGYYLIENFYKKIKQ